MPLAPNGLNQPTATIFNNLAFGSKPGSLYQFRDYFTAQDPGGYDITYYSFFIRGSAGAYLQYKDKTIYNEEGIWSVPASELGLVNYYPGNSGSTTTVYVQASHGFGLWGEWASATWNTTQAEFIAPTVTAVTPALANANAAVGANIVFTFNETIARGSGTIQLRSGSAVGTVIESFDVATSSRLRFSGNQLTIDPTLNLNNSTQYYLVVPSGAVKDLSNNSYLGTSGYYFTTAAPPDTTAPTVTAVSPVLATTNIAVGANIVFTFSETIARGSGTIQLRSGSALGTVIESFDAATSSRLSLSGNQLTIDPTLNLNNSTQYYLVVPSGAVKDLSNNSYLGTSGYYFTTAAPPDTTAPTVTAVSPVLATTNIAVGANIVFTFSETIARGSGTIQLRSGSALGTVIESFDAATSSRLSLSGNQLTIDPTLNLNNSTQYYLVVPSGAVKDLSNNSYLGTSGYYFTTAAPPDTTAPTVTAVSPVLATTNIAVGANIVFTFSETIARGSGTIQLRSGSALGTVIESFDAATSSRLSLSGNQLTIDPTLNLNNSTQYYLVVPSGAAKDLSNNSYLGTSGYYFTTAAPPDTTAPTVTAVSPVLATTNIAVGANIVFTFSETIARGSGTIQLRSGSALGTVIESFDAATSSRLSLSGNQLTIDPTSNLNSNTQYYLVVPSGAAKDLSNNSYLGTSSYYFKTQQINTPLPETKYINQDWNGAAFKKLSPSITTINDVPGSVTFDTSVYRTNQYGQPELYTMGWQLGRPVILYAPGWRDGPNKNDRNSTSQLMMTALYEKYGSQYNIAIVDWSGLAKDTNADGVYGLQPTCEITVTKQVGECVADALLKTGVSPSNITLIGHSLGSYVMGAAADAIKSRTGTKIAKLVGLDPAFGEYYDIDVRNGWNPDGSNGPLGFSSALANVTRTYTASDLKWEGKLAGDNQIAKSAQRSYLVQFSKTDFNLTDAKTVNSSYHNAVIPVYADLLRKGIEDSNSYYLVNKTFDKNGYPDTAGEFEGVVVATQPWITDPSTTGKAPKAIGWIDGYAGATIYGSASSDDMFHDRFDKDSITNVGTTFYAGEGDDWLYGGDPSDNKGIDYFYGGAGSDTFVFGYRRYNESIALPYKDKWGYLGYGKDSYAVLPDYDFLSDNLYLGTSKDQYKIRNASDVLSGASGTCLLYNNDDLLAYFPNASYFDLTNEFNNYISFSSPMNLDVELFQNY